MLLCNNITSFANKLPNANLKLSNMNQFCPQVFDLVTAVVNSKAW